jgi:hypothetical protein
MVSAPSKIVQGSKFSNQGNAGSCLHFALIGVVVFWLSFVVIDKLTPYCSN